MGGSVLFALRGRWLGRLLGVYSACVSHMALCELLRCAASAVHLPLCGESSIASVKKSFYTAFYGAFVGDGETDQDAWSCPIHQVEHAAPARRESQRGIGYVALRVGAPGMLLTSTLRKASG
jgi:hypothetical protein